MTSDLTEAHVRARLRTRQLGQRLELKDETGSTNADALVLAQRGAPHGTVVLADRQTAGRGRLGRGWHSPPGCNLYCSVLLRSPAGGADAASFLGWIPLVAGLAAARACQEAGRLATRLKWPNDVLIREKKVGGILCESSGLQQGALALVVGLGLNVNGDPAAFPDEFRERATSLAAEAGQPFDRGRLLAGFLAALEARLTGMESGGGEDVMEEYRAFCATLGRTVRVSLVGDRTLVGTASRIGTDGSLELHPADAGPPLVVRAGDVVHVR